MRGLIILVLSIKLFAISDSALQKLALENGLKPVPKTFRDLLKDLNTTEKELSFEKISLGEKLFFEKDLSLGKDLSCASCHILKQGGADGLPTAIGHKNQKNPFHLNTPTFLNTGFSKKLFWNGRSETLKSQAQGPLQASFEMAITPKLAEERIRSKKEYLDLFQKAFKSKEISFEKIAEAIATFEKTVVTRGRYDEFLEGDLKALTKEEKAGLELFIKKSCIGCHNGIGLGGQSMRKFPMVYHKIWSKKTPLEVKHLREKYELFLEGKTELKIEERTVIEKGFFHYFKEGKAAGIVNRVGCKQCHRKRENQVDKDLMKKISFPFPNTGSFTGSEENPLFFRVPLLRNVARTAPYFHNGSVKDLKTAIKLMAQHQQRTVISDEEVEKIISFLKAVDGEVYRLY